MREFSGFSEPIKCLLLTNHEVETAATVRMFLDLATSWHLSRSYTLEEIGTLIEFLRKYECAGPLTVVRAALRARMTAGDADRVQVYIRSARIGGDSDVDDGGRSSTDNGYGRSHEVSHEHWFSSVVARVRSESPPLDDEESDGVSKEKL